uniref:DOMON domain-containing protein n=1 Tax=Ditylenchus dipsaci TaxID=166011 RepID=A0A915EDV8_9BILA
MIWRNGAPLLKWSISLLVVSIWCQSSVAQPSSVWLLRPASRAEEQSPNAKRVPEATCPTPRGSNDLISTFQPGTSVEIEWRDNSQSAAINPKVEILTSTSDLLTKLESPASAKVIFDATKRSASKVFDIPQNLECKECVLRLTLELRDGTSQMVSCADVQVGAGLVAQNSSFLQQKTLVDCTTNEECSKGECLQGFCYCSAGFYGRNCLNESKSSLSDLRTSKYNLHIFPSNNEFMWRIDPMQNAMEMAVRINIDSSKACQQIAAVHNAIGMSSKAQGVLNKESENSLNSLPDAEEKPVPSVPSGLNIRKINSSTSSLPTSSADCGANEVFSDCPEHSRLCEPSCDWTAFPESIPSCPKACGVARCVCAEGFVRLSNELNECKPFSFCQAAEVVKECPANQTFAKCGTSCEPSCENMYNTEPCEAACLSSGCTCVDNHVRNSNGECINWVNCPHLEERFLFSTGNIPPKLIGDTTSSSGVITSSTTIKPAKTTTPSLVKSSPSEATTLMAPSTTADLTNSATASSMNCPANETVNECGKVCEADCVTIFVREECNECEPPTCACKQGFARTNGTCVYWGDCPVTPGLETPSSKRNKTSSFSFISTTQPPAELKSKEATNAETSQTSNNEISSATTLPRTNTETSKDKEWCHGQWSWPTDCKNSSDCDYKISWTFSPESETVDFFLESKVPPNWWTGVGFSSTGSMHDVDMIVVKSRNGGILTLHDMHVEEYDSLKEDEKNNILSEKKIGTHTQGVLRASFSRKRYTGDDFADYTFNDEKCYKFLFPVSGGRLTENGTISNPLTEPHVSSEEICIKACPKQLVQKSEYSCQTAFHYPRAALAKDIWFEVSSKGIGRWTGIGFSRDGNMTSSDVYTGWVYDGKPYLTDRFAYGRQLPAIEPADRQNIYNMSGRATDDVQTISFNRKIVTTDTLTDFPLDKCYHFLYPVGGGRVLARKSQDFKNAKTPIGYHDQIHPVSSKTKICICDSNGLPIGETNQTPARVRARDPFACSDVAIIELLDHQKLLRVADGFAFTKSAIKPDEAFGGSFSLMDVSAAYDAEEGSNNTITVLIRRPLNGNEIADFSFGNGPNRIYLARGHGPVNLNSLDQAEFTDINFNEIQKSLTRISSSQLATQPATKSTSIAIEIQEFTPSSTQVQEITSTSTSSTTTATIATTASSTAMPIPELEAEFDKEPFSVNPELKMIPDTTIHTTETTTTTTETIIPETISESVPSGLWHGRIMCTYSVTWRIMTDNTIDFMLTAKMSLASWTGVGFSPDGSMVNSDAVIISLLADSSTTIMDEFSPGYGRPRIDKAQDIFNCYILSRWTIISKLFEKYKHRRQRRGSRLG